MPRLSALPNEASSLHALVAARALGLAASPYVLAARSGESISYGELAQRVSELTTLLEQRNVHAGERVGLVIGDPLRFTTTFIAGLSADMWVAPLDPHVMGGDTDQLNRQAERLHLRVVLSDRPAPPGVKVDWIDLTRSARDLQAVAVQQLSRTPSASGGIVLSSSGTTGTPKIIALATEQLLFVAQAVVELNDLDERERGLNPLPLWHINAEVVGLLCTLVAGASLVLDDRFHRSGFWAMADQFEVTWINAVPAMIARLALLEDGETVPTRVRFVRSASAPLSPELLERFETTTGLSILESYGMTEAASQICANQLDGPRKAGSVGRPIGVEVRISNAGGPDSEAGVVGEVEIRGPSVIRSYEAPGYEERFDVDGWLRTSDVGYFDDDGFLFLVGRSDDVINRGGEKIFPREIEELVLALDSVEGAALVGMADDVYGQVPVLFVQLGSHESATSLDDAKNRVKQIRDALVAAIGRTRRPAHINVVEVLPTNATGKIKRKDLQAGLVTVLIQEPVL
jgi:acyl-CoA synthetase (AMP-forming)/AMP-acid ligase II